MVAAPSGMIDLSAPRMRGWRRHQHAGLVAEER